MATKYFVTAPSKGIRANDILGYWDLAAGDVAAPVLIPRYSDKSIQMFGVWGGASITLQASNDPDLINFQPTYDAFETTITQTADRKAWVILPNSLAVKPVLTGGDGTTAVRVALVAHGAA